jgi:hypothetical protein
MAVLSEISVGDIRYYTVDDIPSHLAPKGSIAILYNSMNKARFYKNIDGSTNWSKLIDFIYGEASVTNSTVEYVADTDHVLGSWYVFAPSGTWVAGQMDGFSLQNTTQLTYTGDTSVKVIGEVSSTLRSGPSKWVEWLCGISKNLVVPTRFNGGFGQDNARTDNISAVGIFNMIKNDSLISGESPVTRESGGGTTTRSYLPKHSHIKVVKLDEGVNSFLENWETNSFSTNNWSVVNDTTNVWVIGTAQNITTGGSRAVYISNDGGTTAAYTVTVANISHIYIDLTIPSSANDALLVFDWKSWGENAAGATQYDYGTVNMVNTTTTPVAGAELSSAQATLDALNRPTGNGRIGAITNLGKFNLGYGGADNTWRRESISLKNYIGLTKRIVFSWVNDGTVGNNPPFVIDDIKLVLF